MATIDKHTFRMIICGLLVLLFVLPVRAFAQDAAPVDSTAWKKSLGALLSGSQASYDNWAEGGINSLAFTASLTGDAQRNNINWIQKHEMRLALGALKQDSLDIRKADDLIQFVSNFQYQNDDAFAQWHPTGAIELRTQFANGFDYGSSPSTKVSAFFAPATFLETVGFSYAPEDWYSWLIGIGAKQTIVGIEELRPIYGNELDETLRFEMGFNSKASLDKDIFENVHLKTGLSVFAAFGQIDKPDVRWENLVTMTVNSWLTVGFEFVTFYDLDITKKVQLKQVLSTGISVGIL